MRVTILLLLLGLAALALAGTTSYHGHRLVSVRPSTQADVDLVNSLVKTHHLQEWTYARGPGVPVNLLVPPQSFKSLLGTLHRNSIPVTVNIDDVQAIIDQQKREHPAPEGLPRAFDHTQYHSLAEIYSILDGAEADFSFVSTYTAGTTYEGRDIRVAKVSTGGTKEAIWIDCGIHACEWISPATCQYILDQLTSGYGSDSEVTALLDTYDFHIMPSVNPDGYEFTWTNNRLWRKNRVPYADLDCHGTDPNRNFDANFGGVGSSDNPCWVTYHGPSPFSEFETQAVRDALLALDVKVYFSLHSFGQLWLTPYGYTNSSLPENYDELVSQAPLGELTLGTPRVSLSKATMRHTLSYTMRRSSSSFLWPVSLWWVKTPEAAGKWPGYHDCGAFSYSINQSINDLPFSGFPMDTQSSTSANEKINSWVG